MRVLVLATMLLVSSSLPPARAQEVSRDTPKSPLATPQTVPATQDRGPAPSSDQFVDRDRASGHEREVNRDVRIHRGDGQMGQGERDIGPGMMMQREHAHRDDDKDRDRYGDRDDRSERRTDRADPGRGYGNGRDQDAPRRRVKVCIEYDNGDEYCRDQQR